MATLPTPTLPTIHLNGSGAERLCNLARAAHDGISEAINTVYGAAPHARDYYTQGDDAYRAARAEFDAHLVALMNARAFFAAHALHAADSAA